MIIAPAGILRVNVGGGNIALPPYYPLSLPGVEEYYDSRTPALTLAHGASINPWADLSGHSPIRDMGDMGFPGIILQPTLLKTSNLSPKGLPRVRWNGTDNGLVTGTINPFPAATNGFTYYCKGKWSLTSAPPAAFAGAVLWNTSAFGSAPKELLVQSVGTNLRGWRDSGGFHLPKASLTGEHQFAWVFNPPSGTGVCEMYVDGALVDNSAVWTVAGATADTTQLGGALNVPINADTDHFVWYSRAHSAQTVFLHYLWGSIYWGF